MDSITNWMKRELRRMNRSANLTITQLEQENAALQATIDELSTRLTDCESDLDTVTSALRLGRISLPLMTVLSPPNVQNIVWTTPMPSASYETYVMQDQLIALGASRATVTAKTANGLTVTTSPGVVALGTQVLVLAWYIQTVPQIPQITG